MNRKEVCTCTLVSVLLLILIPVSPTALAIPTLYVDPASIIDLYGIGESFTVEVKISGVTELYSWYIGVQWNPNILECTAVAYVGTFLPGQATYPNSYLDIPGTIDNTEGKISPPYSRTLSFPNTAGVSGSGTLMNATFQVKAFGETWINFTDETELLDSSIINIVFDMQNCSFKLTGPEPPVASFTVSPAPHYVNELITFNASSSQPGFNGTDEMPITSYSWDFGDGDTGTGMITTHAYTSSGLKTVNLTVTAPGASPETDSTQQDVMVYPSPYGPTANFTFSPPSPLVGELVTFDASLSEPGHNGSQPMPITSYTWDFGDGTSPVTETDPITTHAYTSSGLKTVNLTVTAPGASPETDSTQQEVTVYLGQGPTAIFEYSPYPYPQVNSTVTFDAGLSESGFNGTDYVPIANYTWDFGDGNVTTVDAPTATVTHVFSSAGTFTVNLTVMCEDDPVLISRGITSSSTWQDVTVSLISGSITVKVQLSDGTPVQGAEVKINETMRWTDEEGLAYSPPLENGTYRLEVTYMSITLLNTTFFVNAPVTVTCTVYLPPVAHFVYSPAAPYVGEVVTFDASASHDPDGGSIVSYVWDFGDGSAPVMETTPVTTHTYDNGTFTVTLTVTDNEGDSANFSFNVTVSPLEPPVAHFVYSPAAPYVGDEVTFDASGSYDLDGTIVSYEWSFEGTTKSEVTATHEYAAAGTYPVTLTVTDDDGLNGTFSLDLTVSDLPTYSLTVEVVWSNGTAIEGAQVEVSETGSVFNGTTDASGVAGFLLTGERAYNVKVSYLGVTLLDTTVHLKADTTLRCTVNSEPYETMGTLWELIKELQEDMADRDAQIDELQGNLTDLLNTVAELQGNVTDLLNTISNLQGNLTNIQKDYSSLQNQANTRFYIGIGSGLIIGLVVGVATVLVLWNKIKSPPK